jgi:hypothetical protein
VAACGGRAFAVLPDGTVPTPPGGPRDTGTVRRWPVVDALGLAQRCPASELLPEPPHRAVVLTVPQLLDTVLRRALAAGVDTTLLTVGVSRLYPAGPNPVPPVETVLVLLSGAQDVGAQDAGAGDLQALPSVLLRALAELPRTFVCRRATPWDRLLVDLRMRLPIADMHLGPTVSRRRSGSASPADLSRCHWCPTAPTPVSLTRVLLILRSCPVGLTPPNNGPGRSRVRSRCGSCRVGRPPLVPRIPGPPVCCSTTASSICCAATCRAVRWPSGPSWCSATVRTC